MNFNTQLLRQRGLAVILLLTFSFGARIPEQLDGNISAGDVLGPFWIGFVALLVYAAYGMFNRDERRDGAEEADRYNLQSMVTYVGAFGLAAAGLFLYGVLGGRANQVFFQTGNFWMLSVFALASIFCGILFARLRAELALRLFVVATMVLSMGWVGLSALGDKAGLFALSAQASRWLLIAPFLPFIATGLAARFYRAGEPHALGLFLASGVQSIFMVWALSFFKALPFNAGSAIEASLLFIVLLVGFGFSIMRKKPVKLVRDLLVKRGFDLPFKRFGMVWYAMLLIHFSLGANFIATLDHFVPRGVAICLSILALYVIAECFHGMVIEPLRLFAGKFVASGDFKRHFSISPEPGKANM